MGRRLAQVPGHGALLVLDRSPTGRWHAYGVALSTDREFLSGPWRSLTGAVVTACKVKVVTGSKDFWSGSDNRRFAENLRRVAAYSFKDLPPGAEHLSLSERLLCASGPFAAIWSAARARHPRLAGTAPAPPSEGTLPALRRTTAARASAAGHRGARTR